MVIVPRKFDQCVGECLEMGVQHKGVEWEDWPHAKGPSINYSQIGTLENYHEP